MFSFRLVLVCVISLQVYSLAVNANPMKPGSQHAHSTRDWIQDGGLLCNGKKVQIPDSYENQVNETMKFCTEKMSNLTSILRKMKQMSETGSTNKQAFKDKFLCLVVCQMQELELIDDNGVFVEEEIDNFIKDAIASDEATQLIAKFKECTKKFGNKLEISETCENTEKNRDIITCVKSSFKEVCKLEGIGYLHASTVTDIVTNKKKA